MAFSQHAHTYTLNPTLPYPTLPLSPHVLSDSSIIPAAGRLCLEYSVSPSISPRSLFCDNQAAWRSRQAGTTADHRAIKATQGNPRQLRAVRGSPGQSKAVQGNARQPKATQGNPRQFKAIQGSPAVVMPQQAHRELQGKQNKTSSPHSHNQLIVIPWAPQNHKLNFRWRPVQNS